MIIIRKTLAFVMLIFVLFLIGCEPEDREKDLLDYKGDYTNIEEIFDLLLLLPEPVGEKLIDHEMVTQSETQGIRLTYKLEKKSKEKVHKEISLLNSSYIFTIANNIDWVVFDFPHAKYIVERYELEDYYKVKFEEILTRNELMDMIRKDINRESNSKVPIIIEKKTKS